MTTARRGCQHRKSLFGPISAVILVLLISQIAAHAIQVMDPTHDHPAPGTKLTRFEKIDDGVYKGSEPRNDADYRFLQSKHIKYIVKMRFWPLLDRLEAHKARKYGIYVISVYLNGPWSRPRKNTPVRFSAFCPTSACGPSTFIAPSDATALRSSPLFMKSTFLACRERARDEMQRFGFKQGWTLTGLSEY